MSSMLLFWETEKQSCLAADMIRSSAGESFRGSSSLLWPFFKALCLGSFVETLSCTVQDRPVMTETGMSVFEHSLAFAEAEAMLSTQLGIGFFGTLKVKAMKETAAAVSSLETNRWITRSVLLEKVNTTPEVLLMGFISSLSNLTSHILGVLGLQERYRLLNTAIWGLCFMSSFIWAFFNFMSNEGADLMIHRFPTVYIVGFIPHLLVLLGILGCACIYSLALLLAVLSPPLGLPRPTTWSERFLLAYDNLQANKQLATLRLNMHEDFYTVLLKTGFTTLTIASEAVYLNEGRRIGVHRWTWLEEERLKEIKDTREFAIEHLDVEGTSTVAGGIELIGSHPIDSRAEWKSGYAREKTTKSLKPTPGTGANAEAHGVGVVHRSGRYMGAWDFVTGTLWLVCAWSGLVVVKTLHRSGIKRLPSWITEGLRYDKGSAKKHDGQKTPPTKEQESLEFWMLSDEGVLSLPQNNDVDVEAETRRRVRMAGGSWGNDDEQKLDSTLYSWWKHGGWWGEVDSSGNYVARAPEDDLTSEISAATTESSETGWEDDVYEPEDGRSTPTQLDPHPHSRNTSRETTPFADHALDTSQLARLLDPETQDDRLEARMLSSHLSHPGILTRSQYQYSQSSRRAHLLTSSRFSRPPNFRPSGVGKNARLTPQEEAEILEHLILSKRNQTGLQIPADASGAAGDGANQGSWMEGGDGMGAGGPQCVVCQSAPRTVLSWPCRCLSLCEDCRVSLAMNNFGSCVCCRQEVVGFSRLFVP
ncbi:MAG: hypothetical protein Q9190_005144 [Brigantiaea leucoxantha]